MQQRLSILFPCLCDCVRLPGVSAPDQLLRSFWKTQTKPSYRLCRPTPWTPYSVRILLLCKIHCILYRHLGITSFVIRSAAHGTLPMQSRGWPEIRTFRVRIVQFCNPPRSWRLGRLGVSAVATSTENTGVRNGPVVAIACRETARMTMLIQIRRSSLPYTASGSAQLSSSSQSVESTVASGLFFFQKAQCESRQRGAWTCAGYNELVGGKGVVVRRYVRQDANRMRRPARLSPSAAVCQAARFLLLEPANGRRGMGDPSGRKDPKSHRGRSDRKRTDKAKTREKKKGPDVKEKGRPRAPAHRRPKLGCKAWGGRASQASHCCLLVWRTLAHQSGSFATLFS